MDGVRLGLCWGEGRRLGVDEGGSGIQRMVVEGNMKMEVDL